MSKEQLESIRNSLKSLELYEILKFVDKQAERVQDLKDKTIDQAFTVEKKNIELDDLKEKLNAKLAFVADGNEEERWALQERVQELEGDLAREFNGHKAIEHMLSEQNKRYREALVIISANLPLDGREHYVSIARKALEGTE